MEVRYQTEGQCRLLCVSKKSVENKQGFWPNQKTTNHETARNPVSSCGRLTTVDAKLGNHLKTLKGTSIKLI